MSTSNEASIFVIFGSTGDLSMRKLLPALASLAAAGRLPARSQILGLGRAPHTDESFRQLAAEALGRLSGLGNEAIGALLARLHYFSLGEGGPEDYRALGRRLDEIAAAHELPPNRSFYMSLPPEAFPGTVDRLGEAGLHAGRGFTRLVVEKPFGRDLASAQALNALLHRHFTEEQIYRIDHYLGKETVQNLLAFRLANGLIESAWNRDRIEAVQITVAETLGIGTRAGYYDHAGALRDMVQNHISQILTLVAMEVPYRLDAEAIRLEKRKVLCSIAPIDRSQVVRGQYAAGAIAGEPACGYLEERGVPAGSSTETFVALRLHVDSYRWNGVPFYLRTGKRMPKKTTQIAIRFRDAPGALFRRFGAHRDSADVLLIHLQPDEGFSLHLDIKAPGESQRLQRIPLRFSYGDHFAAVPDAYETLIHDVLTGDQTLFVHGQEVEESWQVFQPLLQEPTPIRPYAAGTWGPPEAEGLAIADTELWQQGA